MKRTATLTFKVTHDYERGECVVRTRIDGLWRTYRVDQDGWTHDADAVRAMLRWMGYDYTTAPTVEAVPMRHTGRGWVGGDGQYRVRVTA